MSNVRENAGSYKKADFCMMYYTLLLFSCFAGWTGESEPSLMFRACRRQSGTDIEREDLRSKRTKRSFDLVFPPKKKTENKMPGADKAVKM